MPFREWTWWICLLWHAMLVGVPGAAMAGATRYASFNTEKDVDAYAASGLATMGTILPPAAGNVPIPSGFTEQAPDTHTTMPPLKSSHIVRGYTQFVGRPTELVYPSTAPMADQIHRKLDFSSTPGEYEPATFSIRSLKKLRGINAVMTGDLVGPGGATIGADHVDIRSARYMPRRVFGQPHYIRTPTALEQRSNLSVGANTTQQFWVTIKTPKKAAPGLYEGTLEVQFAEAGNLNMKVRLQVQPFTLDPTPTAHGMYYTPVDLENGNAAQPLSDARLWQDVANMAAHGMNTLFISIPPPMNLVNVQGKMRFDLDPILPLIDAYEEHGFGAVVYNTSEDNLISSPIGFGAAAKALADSFAANGSLAPIFSAGDEGDASGLSGGVQSWINQLNSTVPDERTFTTIVFPENQDTYENLDIRAFSSYIDQTVLGFTRPTELWQYSGTASYGADPIGDRLYRGLWTRLFDLDGALQWTYFRPNLDPTQPYQDLFPNSVRNNMTMWSLPGLDGPIPTPGWEAMREGINDERYFLTLQRLIGEALAIADQEVLGLGIEAQQFLNATLAEIDVSPRADDSEFPIRREAAELAPSFFDDFRTKATNYIVALGLVVPEPSVAMFFGVGMLTLLARRCR